MPGYLAHQAATVLCAHGGQATPTATYPRVKLSGNAAVVLTTPYVVAGCAMPPPPPGTGPCVSGQWATGTVRVRVLGGLPLVVQGGQAVCVPTGTPLTVAAQQIRVRGT
ncbi:hypothetical protein [Catellatospora chokoriensis]|uniref:PAAR motif-containing protein n=1 Tax=Catellatospora chokoriensis TaxID=310353 RepID=A0A8J3NTP3_9ACTN|nr:hypothetical protein [Catellatospora chokoriensis]GIF90380.1 hypothetical protein Cch02nite_38240 [Catellatospora chokoriensis]